MNERILRNLNNIDIRKYKDLLALMNEDINTDDYFINNYNIIMEKWHKDHEVFDIPNILCCVYINGEIKYYSKGLKKDNVFDLASMSKVYTEYILFNVINDYDLSIYSRISDLTKEYFNIKDLSLFDLIKFRNTFYTTVDIRKCKNKKEAVKALRTVKIEESKRGYYLYTDLPIMVLTDILELYTGMDFYQLFDKYIVKRFGFKNTHLRVRYNNSKYITINKRYVNDPKANIMGGFYGHAGVKATAEDFCKFLSILMNHKYYDLFTTDANCQRYDGVIKHVGIIGNSNISDRKNESLASIYLPKNGFAVQGSTRCHAEAAIFNIRGKEYKVITCIFTDLYTQYKNALKFEKEKKVEITRAYKVKKANLKMCDVRKVFPYTGAYKQITDLIGRIRVIDLKNYLENNNI